MDLLISKISWLDPIGRLTFVVIFGDKVPLQSSHVWGPLSLHCYFEKTVFGILFFRSNVALNKIYFEFSLAIKFGYKRKAISVPSFGCSLLSEEVPLKSCYGDVIPHQSNHEWNYFFDGYMSTSRQFFWVFFSVLKLLKKQDWGFLWKLIASIP